MNAEDIIAGKKYANLLTTILPMLVGHHYAPKEAEANPIAIFEVGNEVKDARAPDYCRYSQSQTSTIAHVHLGRDAASEDIYKGLGINADVGKGLHQELGDQIDNTDPMWNVTGDET